MGSQWLREHAAALVLKSLVCALAYHEAGLLLCKQQLVTLLMAQVAHVADFAETEVVVEASLASPVTHSLLVASLVLVDAVVLAVLVGVAFRSSLLLALLLLPLFAGVGHVLRLAFEVFVGLGLLAPKASFSSFEIVVLALAALPASLGELKVLSSFNVLLVFLLSIRATSEAFLVEGFDASCKLSCVSNLINMALGRNLRFEGVKRGEE